VLSTLRAIILKFYKFPGKIPRAGAEFFQIIKSSLPKIEATVNLMLPQTIENELFSGRLKMPQIILVSSVYFSVLTVTRTNA
jgi:hypothetical protein